MQARGLCMDKFENPDEEEFCQTFHTAYRFKDEQKHKVLLVGTNRAVHEFVEPLIGNKQHLTHVQTIFYEQFSCITRNHSGQAIHLEIFLDSGKITKSKVVYVMYEYAELDILVKKIMSRAPRFGRTRTTIWPEDCHLDFLMKESKMLQPEESILTSFLFKSARVMGSRHDNLYLIITNSRLLMFIANFEYWHLLAPTTPLPWWSDKTRFIPISDGVRGWDVRFLAPVCEPLELKTATNIKVFHDDAKQLPQLVISFGDKKEGSSRSFFSFAKDPFKESLVLEFITYSNCCYIEQMIKMGMINNGAKFG
jgi:hypothetical protein